MPSTSLAKAPHKAKKSKKAPSAKRGAKSCAAKRAGPAKKSSHKVKRAATRKLGGASHKKVARAKPAHKKAAHAKSAHKKAAHATSALKKASRKKSAHKSAHGAPHKKSAHKKSAHAKSAHSKSAHKKTAHKPSAHKKHAASGKALLEREARALGIPLSRQGHRRSAAGLRAAISYKKAHRA